MSKYEGLDTLTVVSSLESVTGFTVLGNDTTGLAVSTAAPLSENVMEFNKVDGAANTKLAGASATLSVHLGGIKPTDLLSWWLYVSAVTDVDYAFVRLGVDSSNYNEYRFSDSGLSVGWNWCKVKLGEPTSVTGTGMATPSISIGHGATYAAIGVAFDAEGNALAGIKAWRLAVEPCSIVEDV